MLTAVCIPITEYLDKGILLAAYIPISLKIPLAPLPNISVAVPSLPRKKKAPIIIIGANIFIPKVKPLLIYLVTSPNDVLISSMNYR